MPGLRAAQVLLAQLRSSFSLDISACQGRLGLWQSQPGFSAGMKAELETLSLPSLDVLSRFLVKRLACQTVCVYDL